MGTTATELVNRAVQIYLEKGYVQDDENNARFGMNFDITQELGQTSQFDEKVGEINTQIKGLQARLESMESKIQQAGEVNQESIQTQINYMVQKKVDPVLSELLETIKTLNQQTSKMTK